MPWSIPCRSMTDVPPFALTVPVTNVRPGRPLAPSFPDWCSRSTRDHLTWKPSTREAHVRDERSAPHPRPNGESRKVLNRETRTKARQRLRRRTRSSVRDAHGSFSSSAQDREQVEIQSSANCWRRRESAQALTWTCVWKGSILFTRRFAAMSMTNTYSMSAGKPESAMIT